MIYDFEHDNLGPARIFDANGLEWTKVCICDDKQGLLVRLKSDKDGKPLVKANVIGPVKEFVRTAAPLRILFEHVTLKSNGRFYGQPLPSAPRGLMDKQ